MASQLTELRKLAGLQGRLTNLSARQIASRPRGKGYSAHSIKRGAPQAAAHLANQHDLQTRSVVALAKHADPLDIPGTTVRYMGMHTTQLTHSHVLPGLLGRLI
ncbi:hypothetical protein NESM_000726300 [Novymonas esmeraldas]|uniref:Uncharacterized protein n=1 Tax=Novymonas esmeraldas TaxID=1808958 RepID=A0AAW0EX79_9TRYP